LQNSRYRNIKKFLTLLKSHLNAFCDSVISTVSAIKKARARLRVHFTLAFFYVIFHAFEMLPACKQGAYLLNAALNL
jgi:hypothetical protein